MNKYSNCTRTHWLLFIGLTFGLAATALTRAAQPKLDLGAEATQAAQEDADQQADRDKGIKHQRKFTGMFAALTEASKDLAPDVVGSFTTESSDKKPGRTYLVKVADGNKSVLKTLAHFDGKKAQVTGKLRVLDSDGEAKYIVVIDVMAPSATPRARQRVGGGL